MNSVAQGAAETADEARMKAENAQLDARSAMSTAQAAMNRASSLDVNYCYYEFANPNEDTDESYRYDTRRDDDLAIVAYEKQNCYNSSSDPDVSLTRDSAMDWQIVVSDWAKDDNCNTLEMVVVFMNGPDVEHNGTRCSNCSYDYDLSERRSWGSACR